MAESGETTVLPPHVQPFEMSRDYATTVGANIADKLSKVVVSSTDNMSSTELRLRRWFKCTKFDDNCFATRNSCQQFVSHLQDKHTDQVLFCVYCNQIGDENKFWYKHNELVDHIIKRHPYRNYQCNLCLYRSVSVDHLLVHQSSVHSRSFDATFDDQTESSATNTTEELDSNETKRCKIIECTPLTDEPKPDHKYYYDQYKHERLNDEMTKIQCCFCDYMDISRCELYAHCVAAHPDYPILVYTGTSENTVNGEVDGDGDAQQQVIQEVVVDGKKTKGRKRSIDETDVSTNGVIDTYEFDIWTESEEEDMNIITEDDFSSDGEPDVKRRRSSETDQELDAIARNNNNTGAHKTGRRVLSDNLSHNYQYCLAAVCVSALIVAYLSMAVLSQ